MASFVVMQPPDGQRGEERMVRDGFAWPGLVLPVLWLFWHRLWLEGLVALALIVGFSALSAVSGWAAVASMLSLSLSVLVALEGPSLRLAALRRRGWREWGVVEAGSDEDAELRYLLAAGGRGDDRLHAVPINPAPAAGQGAVPALGLLGYSGRS